MTCPIEVSLTHEFTLSREKTAYRFVLVHFPNVWTSDLLQHISLKLTRLTADFDEQYTGSEETQRESMSMG